MFWTSSKFVTYFILILIVSLSILIYFSTKDDISESDDSASDGGNVVYINNSKTSHIGLVFYLVNVVYLIPRLILRV